jgi:hypothetical protein
LSILAAIARVGASRVDHQLGSLHREVAEALVDVQHRADEVHADLLSGTSTKDVSPELLALLDHPRIGALINWDDELGDGTQDLEELGSCGFHEPAMGKMLFWIDARTAEHAKEDREVISPMASSRARNLAYLNCSSIGGTGINTSPTILLLRLRRVVPMATLSSLLRMFLDD